MGFDYAMAKRVQQYVKALTNYDAVINGPFGRTGSYDWDVLVYDNGLRTEHIATISDWAFAREYVRRTIYDEIEREDNG